MTRASGVDAELEMDAIPLLAGAMEFVSAGILSSLQPANLRLHRAISDLDKAASHPIFPLLFDPQTAGGLLAGVPGEKADQCVSALLVLGFPHTGVIGYVRTDSGRESPIKLI